MAGLSMRRFLRNVWANVAMVAAAASVLPAIVHFNLPYGWERFLAVGILGVACACACASAYAIGCTPSERRFIRSRAVAAVARFIDPKRGESHG